MIGVIPLLEWDSNKKTKETACILAIGTFALGYASDHVSVYSINETTHTLNYVPAYRINKTTYALTHKLIDKISRMSVMTHWYIWSIAHVAQT